MCDAATLAESNCSVAHTLGMFDSVSMFLDHCSQNCTACNKIQLVTNTTFVSPFAGESKPLSLKATTAAFAQGGVDTFQVQAPELGPLTQICISHDGKGPHPDWMVERVRIVHVQSAQEWLFFGHTWLHPGNDNQAILKPGQCPQ